MLRYNIQHALDVSEIEDIDQIRVIEPSHCFSLGLKRMAQSAVVPNLWGQDLDCDSPVQRQLFSLIKCPSDTGGDQFGHLVARDQLGEFFRCWASEFWLSRHSALICRLVRTKIPV